MHDLRLIVRGWMYRFSHVPLGLSVSMWNSLPSRCRISLQSALILHTTSELACTERAKRFSLSKRLRRGCAR